MTSSWCFAVCQERLGAAGRRGWRWCFERGGGGQGRGELAGGYRPGGQYVAKCIRARLAGKTVPPPFHYFNKGDMAVIGRAAAVANIFGVHVSGLPAWLIWLFVHLMYIVEFQSRIIVFIQWGFEYLTFSRGARLITGVAATDSLEKPAAMSNTGDGR